MKIIIPTIVLIGIIVFWVTLPIPIAIIGTIGVVVISIIAYSMAVEYDNYCKP
jgi:hypothetical protein